MDSEVEEGSGDVVVVRDLVGSVSLGECSIQICKNNRRNGTKTTTYHSITLMQQYPQHQDPSD